MEESTSGQRLSPVESTHTVVSGGSGVNEQGFALLEELAERLDDSLPAVDAGRLPVVCQVGMSGKFVSPGSYLAVGISGTPQYLAGISLDTRIVAINKDRRRISSRSPASAWRGIVHSVQSRMQLCGGHKKPLEAVCVCQRLPLRQSHVAVLTATWD